MGSDDIAQEARRLHEQYLQLFYWTHIEKGERVGHLSLRGGAYKGPEHFYISLYPANERRDKAGCLVRALSRRRNFYSEAHDREQVPKMPVVDLSGLCLDVRAIDTFHDEHVDSIRFSLIADYIPTGLVNLFTSKPTEFHHCTSYTIKLLNVGGLFEHTYDTRFLGLGGSKHLILILSRSTFIPIILFTVGVYMLEDDKTEAIMGPGGAILGVIVNGGVVRLLELYFEYIRLAPQPFYQSLGEAFASIVGWPKSDSWVLFLAAFAFVAPLLVERHIVDYRLTDSRPCSTFMYDIAFLLAAFFAALFVAASVNFVSAIYDSNRLVTPESVYNGLKRLIADKNTILPRHVGHALHVKELAVIWPSVVGYLVLEFIRRYNSEQAWAATMLIAVGMILTMTVLVIGPLIVFPAYRIIELSLHERAGNVAYFKRVQQLDRGMIHYQLNVICCVMGMIGMIRVCQMASRPAPAWVRMLTTTPGLFLGYVLSEVLYGLGMVLFRSRKFKNIGLWSAWLCLAFVTVAGLAVSVLFAQRRYCPHGAMAQWLAFVNTFLVTGALAVATYPSHAMKKLSVIELKNRHKMFSGPAAVNDDVAMIDLGRGEEKHGLDPEDGGSGVSPLLGVTQIPLLRSEDRTGGGRLLRLGRLGGEDGGVSEIGLGEGGAGEDGGSVSSATSRLLGGRGPSSSGPRRHKQGLDCPDYDSDEAERYSAPYDT